MRAAPLVVLVASLTSACGGSLMKLPEASGGPATDAAAALAEATATCRNITSITAEIGVSGSVGGRRIRGRLLAGLASPSNARLEAPAPFGQPVFIFAAIGNNATLLLPRARRVLDGGRADAVLEAVTGVSMTPAELRTTLTGCAGDTTVEGATSAAGGWMIVPGHQRLYLRESRPAGPWQLVAAVQKDAAGIEWRSEYANFSDGLPRSIRLASSDGRRFSLHLVLSQVDTNVPLDDGAFRVNIPPGSDPITLDELRSAGPLAESSATSR